MNYCQSLSGLTIQNVLYSSNRYLLPFSICTFKWPLMWSTKNTYFNKHVSQTMFVRLKDWAYTYEMEKWLTIGYALKVLLNCKSRLEQTGEKVSCHIGCVLFALTRSCPSSVWGRLGITAHWSAVAKPGRFIDGGNDKVRPRRSATSAITAWEGHNKV